MGFHDWWVHLILKCVNSVSYQVVHEKKEMGPIIPSRGIRQGDLLSPCSFCMLKGYLHCSLNMNNKSGFTESRFVEKL